jgi:hypothetical protein
MIGKRDQRFHEIRKEASDVEKYTRVELTEALRAVDSVIHKCEKAQEKFPEGNSHHTLLRNRLKAMYISKALIEEALKSAE